MFKIHKSLHHFSWRFCLWMIFCINIYYKTEGRWIISKISKEAANLGQVSKVSHEMISILWLDNIDLKILIIGYAYSLHKSHRFLGIESTDGWYIRPQYQVVTCLYIEFWKVKFWVTSIVKSEWIQVFC